MFDFLYNTTRIQQVFGEYFKAPEGLEHGKETLVAIYPKAGRDGQEVRVYCTAMPARSFTLKAQKGKNSVGEPIKAFELTTGSSMEEWTAQTAQHIAEGILGVK